jgi:hypothetical protein
MTSRIINTLTKSKGYFLVYFEMIHEFYKKEDSNRALKASGGNRTFLERYSFNNNLDLIKIN